MSSASGLYIDPSTGQANINMAPFRNRFINGDMRIDQRNAGASTGNLSATGYTVDRWKLTIAGGGTIAAQQVATVPAGTIFTNSLRLTVGTADTSLTVADKYDLRQPIEGNNVYDFAFGTSVAATVTVSFWVQSSIAGTYALALQNGAGDRSYVTTYTIAAANTWQFVSVTVAGDTTGTWLKDNGAGLSVIWGLSQNGSSTQTATLNAWQASSATTTAGVVNWIGTAGATFFLTGAQIERGTVASTFETRGYGAELGFCMRYFEIVPSMYYSDLLIGSSYLSLTNFKTQKRSSSYAVSRILFEQKGNGQTNVCNFDVGNEYSMQIASNYTSSGAARGYHAIFTVNAEL
jgi:hypothetical protein